jgi:hypothetical protein
MAEKKTAKPKEASFVDVVKEALFRLDLALGDPELHPVRRSLYAHAAKELEAVLEGERRLSVDGA